MQFFAPRRLSCGVIILNPSREVLLCHVTGQDHWDLPKGGIVVAETPSQAALRETQEETGLRLDAERLLDLGRFAYRPKKDLHLFATLQPRVDVSRLSCTSHFSIGSLGRLLPEMDGYHWAGFNEVSARCTPKMVAVLAGSLDLASLLDRLLAMQQPVLAA